MQKLEQNFDAFSFFIGSIILGGIELLDFILSLRMGYAEHFQIWFMILCFAEALLYPTYHSKKMFLVARIFLYFTIVVGCVVCSFAAHGGISIGINLFVSVAAIVCSVFMTRALNSNKT